LLTVAFKLLVTPLIIGIITLVGRRFGLAVSGMLVGLPLVSGPVSFIMAYEFGPDFAAHAAIGCMAGNISFCVFCLSYARAAQRFTWPISGCLAILCFLLSTLVLNCLVWRLLSAFVALLIVIASAATLIPREPVGLQISKPPRWDLPVRIIAATVFVVVLTTVADDLGPQLSGLLTPFPVFAFIFATFTHFQQGGKSTSILLRGVVISSFPYAAFFLVVGSLLPTWGIALTYVSATLLAAGVSGTSYFIMRSGKRPAVG
jgi:uncharacterized membrane protein (GlpM family)